MRYLIIKDIEFNKKYCILGLIAAFGFSFIILDGVKYEFASYFMVPALLFSLMIGKMCHMEDTISVYSFLKSLPCKKRDLVVSKYIESFGTIIISYCIFVISNIVLSIFTEKQYDLTSSIMLYMFSMIIIYNSIYLYLNYRFNYSIAQQTSFILIIFYIAILSVGQYIKYDGVLYKLISDGISSIVSLVIASIISIIFCILSIKSVEKRNN